jgi:hypothetical protein
MGDPTDSGMALQSLKSLKTDSGKAGLSDAIAWKTRIARQFGNRHNASPLSG